MPVFSQDETLMKRRLVVCALSLLPGAPAFAQSHERVVVYGTLENSEIGLAADKVAGAMENIGADELGKSNGGTVLGALETHLSSAHLSDVQGNGLFQNFSYHGFAASPLQGTPQGLAVYQNGVRLNEAFGDTVNWDAIPKLAVASLDVWSANPVFGLNAIGGAVNMMMKNGFTWQGGDLSLEGGSYGHGTAALEYGGNDGDFAFYGAAEGLVDGGWRLHSASDLGRLYGDIGWRGDRSELHLTVSGAQSGLGVVGPTPIEAAARFSPAVFTWPQTTQNRVGMIGLNGKTMLADRWQLQGAAYARAFRQRHIDGNDSDFEGCSSRSSFPGRLCLEDDGFAPPPGGKTTAWRDQFVVLGRTNQTLAFDATAIYGTLDGTRTDATSFGGTLQLSSDAPLWGRGNYFTVGGSLDASAIGFASTSRLGRIFPDLAVRNDPSLAGSGEILHTAGALGYAPVSLAAGTRYYGVYAVDALDISDAVTLTAGVRINAADIDTRDRSGLAPELTGGHGYTHANPLLGLTWKLNGAISAYGGYSQANRAPTPLELDCADPNRPCLLEGSLVADPPLRQVVAESWQAGLRGGVEGLTWTLGLFRTDSENDIVALASTIQGRGFYANVPLTRRQGVDASAAYAGDGWSTHIAYSYLDATYQFSGALAAPNNPSGDAAGNVHVTPGDQLPLAPAHQARAGGEVEVLPGLTLGGDLVLVGSQYYDGDNADQNRKLPARWTVNLRAAWQAAPDWQIFGGVDNLFDRHDPSYGTYFSPEDTDGLYTPALADPRSITLPRPISFRIGVKLTL
jgi:iron complex outermembrane receptor protein